MSLALPKEVEEAIALAEALKDEVASIQQVAAEFSERVQEFDQNVEQAASTAARVAYQSTGSLASGAGWGLAALAIGKVAGMVMEAIGEAKRERALAALLERKQDVASEKLPYARNLLPRLQGNIQRLHGFLARDGATVLGVARMKHQVIHQQGLGHQFRALVTSEQTAATLAFLIEEFEAWCDGYQEGNAARPQPEAILWRSTEPLLMALPARPDTHPERMSAASIFLLCSAEHEPLFDRDVRMRRLLRSATYGRLRSLLVPFGATARVYRQFHSACLKKSAMLRRGVWRRLGVGMGSLLVLLAAVTGYRSVKASEDAARVQAVLGTSVCAIESLSEDDLSRSGLSPSELQTRRDACLGARNAEKAKADASRKLEESCARLAEWLEARSLMEFPGAGSRAEEALAARISARGLTSYDLLLGPGDMPCAGSQVAGRIWVAFTNAAANSSGAWREFTGASTALRVAVQYGKSLSPESKAALKERAELLAKEARRNRGVPSPAANEACSMVEGVPGRQCRRILKHGSD